MTMAAKAVRSAQATTCFVAPSMRNYEVFSKRIFALESHDHVVNGKSALEWVMERQCVKTDPASGIVNDANAYANETVADPTYPFALFCRVITIASKPCGSCAAFPRSIFWTWLRRKRPSGAVHSSGLKFHGISASMSLLGHRLAIRSRVCLAQALGSTPFILHV